MTTQRYFIRPAEPEHIELLNDIELAAARIFPPGTIPEYILSDKLPLGVLLTAMDKGRLWVALDAGKIPVGYALLRIIDGFALLAQLDVHPNHGRKGIGAALCYHVIRQVRKLSLTELYLTTFSHVKWNAPFYEKIGFQALEAKNHPEFIKNILHEESKNGLRNRIAMKISIPPNHNDVSS
jgi:N-acetylglutamate synthase-like GNAT family acetyltransferase